MSIFCLRVYLHENLRLHGRLAYEWLLEEARREGVGGGTAFRAIAGYGRHGVLHEERFFELAADLPVAVEFVVTDEQADRLIERLRREAVHAFFVKLPAEGGVVNGKQ